MLTSLRTASVTNPDPILVVDAYLSLARRMFLNFVTGPIEFLVVRLLACPQCRRRHSGSQANDYTTFDLANQTNGVYKCAGF